jgi:hypothetical protein
MLKQERQDTRWGIEDAELKLQKDKEHLLAYAINAKN